LDSPPPAPPEGGREPTLKKPNFSQTLPTDRQGKEIANPDTQSYESGTHEPQPEIRVGIKETKEKIRKLILNSHWSSLKREPQIKLLEETDAGYTFQITVYTLDAKYFQEIESYVKSQIS